MFKEYNMRVVAFKRIKVIVFVLAAFSLVILTFKYKSIYGSHNFDRFNKLKNRKNSRMYMGDENKLFPNKVKNSINLIVPNKEGFRKHDNVNIVEEYTISKEELEKKYQANMDPSHDHDYVNFIPPKGKKYRIIGTRTFAPLPKTSPFPLADLDYGSEVLTNNKFERKNEGLTTNNVEHSNDVFKDSNKTNNIFYEKDNFIKVTNVFRTSDQKDGFRKNIPVYHIPRKKTNILLENQKKQKMNKKTDEPIKDYEVIDGDDEEIEMADGEEYTLIHNILASRITNTPLKNINIPNSVPKHHYIFTSHNLPDNLNQRPSIGNGYVGGVVRGTELHISGLYMGRYKNSHRASIPATCFHNLSISDGNKILLFKKTYKLDVSTGIYSEIWTHPLHNMVQRVYAHRTLRNLMVYEVDYKRGFGKVELTRIKVELNKWRETSDFTFSIHDSGNKEVSYKVGRVNGHETSNTVSPLIHVMYDHVPTELSPSRFFGRTKWVFLTAYAHSEEEVRQAYEEGKRLTVGRDDLIKDHILGWGVLWKRGRVDVTGLINEASSSDTASHLARSIYSSLYYTLSSLPLKFNETFRGLSESGLPFGNLYYPQGGRVRVSQELFIYPPLLLLHNFFARNVVRSRKQTADGALLNAKSLQRRGMLYAFESGYSGVELNEDKSRCDLSPYVSASVSWAIRQYFYSTDDVSFINKMFSSIIFNISDYLQTRLYPAPDAYHINNQIPLDESHGNISDSPFSNFLIKEALLFPHELNTRLGNPPIEQFLLRERLAKDAEKVYLPPMQKNLVPAFKEYNFADRLDEGDVVMLNYPLMVNMTNEMKLANVDFYDQMTLPTSSMPTKAMFLISWLSLGRLKKADNLLNSFLSLNNNAFRTWSPSTKDFKKLPNHLPTMGAFLQVILNGFLGSRLLKDRLDINPSLPLNVSSMHVVGVDYMRHSININIENSSVNLMVTRRHQKAPKLIAHVYNDESRFELTLNKQISLPRTRVAIIRQAVAESFKNKLF